MAKQLQAGKQRKALLKLIDKYYADLAELGRQNVLFEMGTRYAFHRLMADAGKPHGWTLIAEQEKKVGGKTIRPDGTFKDGMNLVRGYWEAKDTGDKLDAEIEKKRKAGYPFNNTIFEDNKTAILYQHGQAVMSVDMQDPDELAELVLQFFRYVEPEIEVFEQAVDEFKERVPDLAEGLKKKIEQSHRTNNNFKQAFADFFELCKTSLNPNISQAAVDEMLIQHILTERLIREIFDNPEFVRRNVIAAEVEKVMLAMTSHSFDRNTYLRDLDRFYVAIEHAARTMTDWSDKQYFLNTVYERFFQGYSVKLADTMGIVYTPQEIVDFMCASVAEVLETEFGKKLWSDDVYIIDPCTGTGNFIVNLIRRIPKAKLEDVYKHRLFANEIMLLPYYIAALNIEHAFFEQAGKYEAFEGLCFVDTLDLAEHDQARLGFMTTANTERVERQKRSPITLVIGNPPYNMGQQNENDNNRNRTYESTDQRIRDTYGKDSRARLKNKLYDAYVKFFRWATDRLEGRDGIVCFVSNNSFVDQIAFDGMRRNLLKDFDLLFHLDLQGNVRHNPTLSGTAYNVFGIQVGVGITIAIRHRQRKRVELFTHAIDVGLPRAAKLGWLANTGSVNNVPWNQINPNERADWAINPHDAAFAALVPIATDEGKASASVQGVIFREFSLGVATNRDDWVYDFAEDSLVKKIRQMIQNYNSEMIRYQDADPKPKVVDSFLNTAPSFVKWTDRLKDSLQQGERIKFINNRVRHAFYRPFARMEIYFDNLLNQRRYRQHYFFPTPSVENTAICLTTLGSEKPFMTLMTDKIVDLHLVGAGAGTQCFPFFVYDEDGTNRRENITDWALAQFREHYEDKKIDKWAIFYYVYGLLHHPGYREKYADNLKRELPRIPFAPSPRPSPTRGEGEKGGFWAFSKAGEKFAKLHLDYEQLKPWDLDFIETPGKPLSYRVEDKMRLNKEKTHLRVNDSLTLAPIPPEVFQYRLGNRSAVEWVIDQYQVSTDKRSGITSDPNRDDDPQYIVRLVGQVIRVSLETVKIVSNLPTEFEPKERQN